MTTTTNHHLLRLGEGVSTGSQSDDRFRKDDTGSRDGSENSVNRDGLDISLLGTLHDRLLTSLPSRGVPSMGTRVLTGKDSGCSESLPSAEPP